MAPSVTRPGVVRFGVFEADLRAGELRRAGVRVKLHDQPFQVLAMLLDRPGELVTREEIRSRLWPGDTFVDFDHGLNNAVARLRDALGDSADTPRFIETLPRRGYRFIAPASLPLTGPEAAPAAAGAVPAGTRSRAEFARGYRKALLISGAAALALAIAAAVLMRKPVVTPVTGPQTIAVLPLQNTTAAKDFDFLRVGLADDIATTLSYFPALSIRPSATSNRYDGAKVDVQQAAREMRVGHIVTGHFAVAGDNLEVTLEAIDTAANRVLWRDSVRGSARDLTGIQQQVASRVQHGLIAALGAGPAQGTSTDKPHNAEAYELYLRAISQPHLTRNQAPFPSANREAIRLLEQAVALDPGYASAWAALGHRYYYDIGFQESGEGARSRARAALRRALALDPGRIDAATDLVNMESEEGELNQAYDDITELLRKRPKSGAVHLVYSFVLWYGGLLDEAAGECEKARSLDAGTTDLAGCGNVFTALGRYDRAREYLQLQSGTEFEKAGEADILLREGKVQEALQVFKSLPPGYGRELLEPCLEHKRIGKTDQAAQRFRSTNMADYDPSPKYWIAAWDSFCGETELAYRELQRAIEQNYCAYPQMETDPLLARVRAMPEFPRLRTLATACRARFLEHRKQVRAE